MKLLLLSNSTIKGQPYLGWPKPYLKEFLSGIKSVIFVPYAGVTISYNEYTQSVVNALSEFNLEIKGVHTLGNKQVEIREADCIMVGGGNTFSLLKKLQDENLISTITNAVAKGAKYVGWSAGSNMVCPTIKTTNDMPIEQPQSFNALNLINFQINPHFTNATIPNHGGESRAMRLEEYLVKNKSSTVVGLPEGMLIEVDDESIELKGNGEAILFAYGKENRSAKVGKLSF